MAEIKKIVLPGVAEAYDIVDQGARDLIAELEEYTDYLGVTTTALTDGATTNPVVITGRYDEVTPVGTENPQEEGWFEYDSSTQTYSLTTDTTVQQGKTYYTNKVTARKGNIVNYGSKEFIFNGTAWAEFGDLSGLGDLAFEDTAEGSYTPAGTMTDPTVTLGGTAEAAAQTVTVGGTASAAAQSISIGGTASAAAQSISLTSTEKSIPNVTAVGSMPTYTVDANGVLEITAGATPTLGTAISVNDVTAATASASSVDLTSVTATASASSVDLSSVTATAQASSVDFTNMTATASGTTFTGTAATITVAKPS